MPAPSASGRESARPRKARAAVEYGAILRGHDAIAAGVPALFHHDYAHGAFSAQSNRAAKCSIWEGQWGHSHVGTCLRIWATSSDDARPVTIGHFPTSEAALAYAFSTTDAHGLGGEIQAAGSIDLWGGMVEWTHGSIGARHWLAFNWGNADCTRVLQGLLGLDVPPGQRFSPVRVLNRLIIEHTAGDA